MDDVTWRVHPVYTAYEVSSDGRIRSVGRMVWKRTKPKRRWRPPRELKTYIDRGYRTCTVSMGGHATRCTMHRLVCETFIGPQPSPEHEVRHLNGIRDDNRIENLCWGTKSENMLDKLRHGTHHEANKTHCPRGHQYTAENTYLLPSAPRKRLCRICRLEQVGRYAKAKSRWRAENDPTYKAWQKVTHCPQGHEYTPENTLVKDGSRNCRQCHAERERRRRARVRARRQTTESRNQ